MKVLMGKCLKVFTIFHPAHGRIELGLDREFDCSHCDARFRLETWDFDRLYSRLEEVEGINDASGDRTDVLIHFIHCPICGGYVTVGRTTPSPQDYDEMSKVA